MSAKTAAKKETVTPLKERSVEPLLSLSTELREPSIIDINGDHYKVLSGDHLGRHEEATVLALFREHDRWQTRLARSKRREDSEKAAGKMRDIRVEVIATLTTIPEKLIDDLGMVAQAQLMEICAKEMGFGDNRPAPGAGDSELEDADLDDDE